MLAATHMSFGAGFGAVLGGLMPEPHSQLVITAAATVGSLLPDMDHPTSKFGRMIWPLSWVISLIFGHRGITHSLLATAALAVYLFGFLNQMPDWALGLVIGYLSHLLGDWLTPAGVPFLWPYKQKFCAPIVFKTGGFGESLFMLLLIVMTGYWLWA